MVFDRKKSLLAKEKEIWDTHINVCHRSRSLTIANNVLAHEFHFFKCVKKKKLLYCYLL